MFKINGIDYQTYKLKDINRLYYKGFIFVMVNIENKKMFLSSTNKFYQNPFSSLGIKDVIWRDRDKLGQSSFERMIIDVAENETELKRLEKYYQNKFNVYESQLWYNDEADSIFPLSNSEVTRVTLKAI